MFEMKEKVMESVSRRIEVLEGDLHDYKDENDKLSTHESSPLKKS